jgi:hypothetical protein
LRQSGATGSASSSRDPCCPKGAPSALPDDPHGGILNSARFLQGAAA